MKPEIAELASRLADRTEAVCERLLPGGRREGAEWRCSGSNSPTGYAISVVVKGHKRGICGLWGEDRGGDMIELVKAVKGVGTRDAVLWAMDFLGLESHQVADRGKARIDKARADAALKLMIAKEQSAQDIWRRGRPIAGTLAEAYLRRRGISLNPWPPSLRFVESLEWTPGAQFDCGRKVKRGPLYPALVAGLQSVDRRFSGIWRIYLDGPAKASISPNKMGLGTAMGSAVRFGPPAETIGVCEGIETGLALVELLAGAMPIWSLLSTSGMMGAQFPKGTRTVHIFADGDAPKRDKDGEFRTTNPGAAAADKLAVRLRAEGIDAIVSSPPNEGLDYLNILQQGK